MEKTPENNIYKKLSPEMVAFLIDNDYGQYAYIYIMKNLWAVSVGKYSPEQFYERMTTNPIFNMDEYLQNFCQKHTITPAKNISPEIQQRINVINNIVRNFKDAINQKLDLYKLYKIYLRFETEANFELRHIEYFEK